jgi:hypothetical protein
VFAFGKRAASQARLPRTRQLAGRRPGPSAVRLVHRHPPWSVPACWTCGGPRRRAVAGCPSSPRYPPQSVRIGADLWSAPSWSCRPPALCLRLTSGLGRLSVAWPAGTRRDPCLPAGRVAGPGQHRVVRLLVVCRDLCRSVWICGQLRRCRAAPRPSAFVSPAAWAVSRPPGPREPAVIRACPLDVWRAPSPPSLPAPVVSVAICGDQWRSVVHPSSCRWPSCRSVGGRVSGGRRRLAVPRPSASP